MSEYLASPTDFTQGSLKSGYIVQSVPRALYIALSRASSALFPVKSAAPVPIVAALLVCVAVPPSA